MSISRMPFLAVVALTRGLRQPPPGMAVAVAVLAVAAVAAPVAIVAQQDVQLPLPCASSNATVLLCVNQTHFHRVPCAAGHAASPAEPQPCGPPFVCVQSPPSLAFRGTASCVAPSLATHMHRSVGLQIVESVGASQVERCSTDPAVDAKAGRMLCETLHAARALQPTFALELGNTWLTFPASGAGSLDGCHFNSTAGWRRCYEHNIRKQSAAFHDASPRMLISAGLMEYLHVRNVDPGDIAAGVWPDHICVPGSVGHWGDGNSTCVPDVRLAAAQRYYVSWGEAFLDAGARAFFFGQARLTGGGADDGSSYVSSAGAAGFGAVIDALRAAAAARGIAPHSLYFAPQAAAGFKLANGTELASWVYGAQHLNPIDGHLTQPLARNGSLTMAFYGPHDFHDANRQNNANGLQVLLDFDNFSCEHGVLDDIRRLAATPAADRAALLARLWLGLRFFNRNAVLSIPLSKQVCNKAGTAPDTPSSNWHESRCLSRGENYQYFGLYSCGLTEVALRLFALPAPPADTHVPMPLPTSVLATTQGGRVTNSSPGMLLGDSGAWGRQLQQPEALCPWLFTALLQRDFGNVGEFTDCVAALPPRMLGAAGALCDAGQRMVSSAEFNATSCSAQPACFLRRALDAFCLGSAQCEQHAAASYMQRNAPGAAAAVQEACDAADSLGLFGSWATINSDFAF